MSADFGRARDLFLEALELPAADRARFVAAATGADEELRDLVMRMLAVEDADSDFLAESPVERGRLAAVLDLARPPIDDDEIDEALPARIPGYRIEGLIGRGGMGLVYEAWQENPHRRVAIKVIRPSCLSPSVLRRFRTEGEVYARLQHPNVATVIETGTFEHRGRQLPFLTMEYVEGQDLRTWVRGHAVDLAQRLQLLAEIAEAVHHAHQRGIIHRDLKPGNILIDRDGRPKIIDFGIAREADRRGADETLTGQVVGTLAYMSPEQLEGKAGDLHFPTDVYALGVIAFEILGGRLPHEVDAMPAARAIRTICQMTAPRLGHLKSELRGDVEIVVAKALEKSREDRYTSADAFARDLRHILADEPIEARRPSAIYNFLKFARRNRVLVAGITATFLTAVVGLVISLRFAREEQRQRRAAEARTREVERAIYRMGITAAEAALREFDVQEAARRLDATQPGLRGWEWRRLRAALDRSIHQLPGRAPGHGELMRPRLLADGHRVVYGERAEDSIVISVWNLDDDEVRRRTLPIPGLGVDVVAHDDGRVAILQPADHRLDIIDVDDPRADRSFELAAEPPAGAGAARDLELDGFVLRYDLGPEMALADGLALDRPFEVSRDGRHLAGARMGGMQSHRIAIWDRRGGELLHEIGDPQNPVDFLAFAFHPREPRLYSATVDGLVQAWDIRDGREIPWVTRVGHSDKVFDIDVSPDGRLLATAGQDRSLRIFDLESGQQLAALVGHEREVRCLRFGADPDLLVSEDAGGGLRVWNWREATTLGQLLGHQLFVYPVIVTPGGATIISGGWDRQIRFWDARTGAVIGRHLIPRSGATYDVVYQLAMAADSSRLAVDCQGERNRHRVEVFDPRTMTPLGTIEVAGYPAVEFDHAGRRLFVADAKELRVFAAEDLTLLATTAARGRLFARGGAGDALLFLSDGLPETGFSVLRTTDLEPVHVEAELPARLRRAAFSHDGRWLALGLEDGTIQIRRCSDWRLERRLVGHTAAVYSLAFSPDDRRLASGSDDCSIRIWDGDSFEELAQLREHRDHVWSLAWTPDGRTLVSASGDRSLRLWDDVSVAERSRALAARNRSRLRFEPEVAGLLERLGAEGARATIERDANRSPEDRSLARQLLLGLILDSQD
ncbi:MAG: serine/threonine protein kinase [Planctomycetes bacterium]|nr:serine/threonine protein kinase [Planctomycetota bacterium]